MARSDVTTLIENSRRQIVYTGVVDPRLKGMDVVWTQSMRKLWSIVLYGLLHAKIMSRFS